MYKISQLNLFCLSLLLFLLPSKGSGAMFNNPSIKAGTARITGSIIRANEKTKDSVFINITVPHPISGEYVKSKVAVDQFGKFSINIDVETNISLVALNTSLKPEKYLLVKLTSGAVTTINITYNPDDDIRNIDIMPAMNQNDMIRGFEIRDKMIGFRPNRAPQPMYNKSTEYFLSFAKTALNERLEIVKNDTLISKGLKEILSKDYRLILYNVHVFDYEGEMIINYRNTSGDKNKQPDIQKIDRNYYHFLRDFNLNDIEYLHCFEFLEFQKRILQNETLGIQEIGENDISTWLANVKVILSDLVGFNDGPYYDILIANAYARQLNEEVRPLTKKQKENILNYWGKGEITKILFRKNDKVVELDKIKSPAVLNEIPSVPSDKIIETIISKYKNKVILFDFWATWCVPCLDAIQRFRSTKNEFRDKDVVFVYLTNGSSPLKLWKEKIKGIGSEHYYLNDSQWEFTMNNFGFEAIPSYLLFNKQGVLINKFTAFPENNKVKKMINELL
ncbi:TlpA family protein disulfide reductase [Pedobacter namyangjuensis]|uniref:TlpA family protein disulfide reductase n=1 Tax=Pedobacter namyangjuensis TaxID=600626 RepID=UPI000DE544FA|nr:TlpA disulfide reductase family protein [Pedobacter namyangjuensis]